jgi:hypothetical protein
MDGFEQNSVVFDWILKWIKFRKHTDLTCVATVTDLLIAVMTTVEVDRGIFPKAKFMTGRHSEVGLLYDDWLNSHDNVEPQTADSTQWETVLPKKGALAALIRYAISVKNSIDSCIIAMCKHTTAELRTALGDLSPEQQLPEWYLKLSNAANFILEAKDRERRLLGYGDPSYVRGIKDTKFLLKEALRIVKSVSEGVPEAERSTRHLTYEDAKRWLRTHPPLPLVDEWVRQGFFAEHTTCAGSSVLLPRSVAFIADRMRMWDTKNESERGYLDNLLTPYTLEDMRRDFEELKRSQGADTPKIDRPAGLIYYLETVKASYGWSAVCAIEIQEALGRHGGTNVSDYIRGLAKSFGRGVEEVINANLAEMRSYRPYKGGLKSLQPMYPGTAQVKMAPSSVEGEPDSLWIWKGLCLMELPAIAKSAREGFTPEELEYTKYLEPLADPFWCYYDQVRVCGPIKGNPDSSLGGIPQLRELMAK